MIQFVAGKPRSGKTLFTVKIIADELRHTRRPIITNAPLKLPELAEYCQQHGIDYGVPVLSQRVRILTAEELPEFYLVRSPDGAKLPVLRRGRVVFQGRPGPVEEVDWSVCPAGGVLYVLDEVHVAFGARRWQETGGGVLYYMTQHAKLSDDVVLVTQSVENVDKALRDPALVQDYTYLRNLSKEKHGLFRMPGVFVRRTFLEPASRQGARAIQTASFTLDVHGLAQCYSTEVGVGIVGRSGGDIGQRAKGMPWWVGVAGLLLVVVSLWKFVPHAIAGYFGGQVGKQIGQPVAHAVPHVQEPQSVSPFGTFAKSAPALEQLVEVGTNGLPLRVTGLAIVNRRGHVCLSDGRVLNCPVERVLIADEYIQVSGHRYLR